MKKYILFVFLFAFLISDLFARPFRVGQIPNGSVNGCANCHVNPAGGGPRNPFGQMVESGFLSQPGQAGQVQWQSALAVQDADGDGVSNGAELQDPEGVWQIGQPAPGNPSAVTNPGIDTDFPTDVADEKILPEKYNLAQNFPNPFNPVTRIDYQLPESGIVMIKVYNSLGMEVQTLLNDYKEAGRFNINFNASDFESGVYYYRLVSEKAVITRKMLLLK